MTKPPVTDIHAHFFPGGYLKLIAEEGERFGTRLLRTDPKGPVIEAGAIRPAPLRAAFMDLDLRRESNAILPVSPGAHPPESPGERLGGATAWGDGLQTLEGVDLPRETPRCCTHAAHEATRDVIDQQGAQPTAAKILGLNAARLYGMDVEKVRAAMHRDDLAWVKVALEEYALRGTPAKG